MKNFWNIFFVLLLISLATLFLLSNKIFISFSKPAKSNEASNFGVNNEYVINNNIAQYSSYIIVSKDEETYRVETLVKLNNKRVENFGGKENFTCFLKRIDNSEIIANLEAYDSPKFTSNSNKKLLFRLKPELVANILLENIAVAVIWKNDFYNESYNHKNLKLPYFLIKFQIPKIVYSQEPRLPSVGFCVHYTYAIPPQLLNWIDHHLSFGVQEIMIYDATENKTLTTLLRNNYDENDNRIQIRPYNIGINDLCNEKNIFERQNLTFKMKSRLMDSCEFFYNNEFKEKVAWRDRHEKITVNDCFTVLSQKYEFIGHYDLDEFVYPRSMHPVKDFYEKDAQFTCNSRESICETTPFAKNYKKNSNYFYNYINSLIEIYRNKRDRNTLGSIIFPHALTIMPNDETEKVLINDLQILVQETAKNKTFPLKVYYNGHTFTIEQSDVDYIKYLSKTYNNLVSCAHKDYLQNISQVDKSIVRSLYYITERKQRWGKAIHYYKNIKIVWVHSASDAVKGAWTINPSPIDGHFLPHYRKAFGKSSFTGSIRKLNIDFEYLFFLLKNYTNFCTSES